MFSLIEKNYGTYIVCPFIKLTRSLSADKNKLVVYGLKNWMTI